MSHLELITFPTEVLLHIFKYLDIHDLDNLRKTCQRFQLIIDDVLFKGKALIITQGNNELVCERSIQKLSTYQKYRISCNWRNGAAIQKPLLPRREQFMPWLHLEKNAVWISRGNYLYTYKRTINKGVATKKPLFAFCPKSKYDICRYVIKNGYILGGQMCGSMFLWSRDTKKFIYDELCHDSDIDDVDMYENLIVSGSRDNTVKVWRNLSTDPERLSYETINLEERVWSVALSGSDFLAIGTTGCKSKPMSIYDLNRLELLTTMDIKSQLYGAGVKQIKWESPQVLWACGYDCCVRRWDMRMGEAVQELHDPFISAIYCFETDFNYSLLTGCQSDGRVVLWDIRKTLPLQLYFMETCKGRWTSPIYSLVYEPCYLFAATASHLNVLDFTAKNAPSKNYRNCL